MNRLRRTLLAGSLGALICISGVRAGPDGSLTLRGRPWKVRAPFGAQFRPGGAVQVVGAALEIDGETFAVEPADHVLRVALTPGAPASRRVQSGGTVRFAWKRDGTSRGRELRFLQRADGSWQYHTTQAMQFKVAGASIVLVDANADGRYELGQDGWAPVDISVVGPLVPRFVLGRVVVEVEALEVDGSELRVRTTPVEGAAMQLEGLELVNRLRVANGLQPMELDAELCKGCTDHALYLERHDWSGFTNPHAQDQGSEGATPEGARAAQGAAIRAAPIPASIDSFYRTYYHRIDLMTPSQVRLGINGEVPRISILHASAPSAAASGAAPVTFVPADRSTGVPTTSHLEAPREPVADLGSRGFPLMAWLPEGATDFGGELHLRGSKQTAVEVFVVPPERGVGGLVPKKPLQGGTLYEATFRWRVGDREEKHTIRFTTG